MDPVCDLILPCRDEALALDQLLPRVPPAFEKLVPGQLEGIVVDATAVQAYYTGALARVCNMQITAQLDGADVVVEANQIPAAA